MAPTDRHQRNSVQIAAQGMASKFVLLVLAIQSAAVEPPPQSCPRSLAGNNILVYPHSIQSVSSPTLPELPKATIQSQHGTTSCGFDGTIVVGGPLSLHSGGRWYAYCKMIHQSLMIFLDWLHGVRGGVQFGGERYAMRFVSSVSAAAS